MYRHDPYGVLRPSRLELCPVATLFRLRASTYRIKPNSPFPCEPGKLHRFVHESPQVGGAGLLRQCGKRTPCSRFPSSASRENPPAAYISTSDASDPVFSHAARISAVQNPKCLAATPRRMRQPDTDKVAHRHSENRRTQYTDQRQSCLRLSITCSRFMNTSISKRFEISFSASI